MHGTIRGAPIAAIKVGVTRGDRTVVDDKSGDRSAGWFARLCRRLLPREKPGQALVCDTGFDLRDCQRYAAGDVKPPGYFIQALLRSENGWTWLAALMDGAEPRWWVELQQVRRIAEAVNKSA